MKQEIQKREPTLIDLINSQKDQIARALPKYMNPDRLIRIAITSLRTTPALKKCTQQSVLGALMMSAQSGLEPNSFGHCYLIPYKNQCQFMIGYRGMLHLIKNSGEVSNIHAEVVRKNDFFDYEYGSDKFLKHKPLKGGGDRGEITDAYSVAYFKDGSNTFMVLDNEELQKIKAASPSKSKPDSPWNKWYSEMCKKSVIKRFSKLLPLAIEDQRKISLDESIREYSPEYEKMIDAPDLNDYKTESQFDNEIEIEIEGEEIPDKEPVKKNKKESNNQTPLVYHPNNMDAYAVKVLDLLSQEYTDPEQMKEKLYDLTTFEKDGKKINGIRDINKLKMPRSKVIYGIYKNELGL
jgi:recombination protein RecT